MPLTLFTAKKYPPVNMPVAFLLYITVSVFISPLFGQAPGKQDEPYRFPNIVIILADDLGFGDLGGYYGGSSRTVHLNQMAKEGMIFTDFHSNPSCSPSRASLLTGRYAQRLGVEVPERHVLDLPQNQKEITMATYLQKIGYVTGIIGKWHLGQPPKGSPTRHGFDEFVGYYGGDLDYFSKVNRDGNPDWWHNDGPLDEEGYVTELITRHAKHFIKKHQDDPFFLYVSHLAVHFPWQAPTDHDLWMRQPGTRYLTDSPGAESKLGPNSPETIPAVLSAMIEALDESVGSILQTLREEKLDENTLVIFLSDNGNYINYLDHWPTIGSNNPLRGQKGGVLEGAHRVPAMAWWPGKIPPLSVSDDLIMIFDWLPTIMDLFQIKSESALDGISILPLLLEDKPLKSRDLFWRVGSRKAVRSDQMKLVVENGIPFLYNLKHDLGETENLALIHPEMVKELENKLNDWERNVDSRTK